MYQLGEIIQGKLIEAIDERHWIVSFDGQLIQVLNTSPLIFEKNKLVKLQITKEKPLELRILTSRVPKHSIDVKI